MPDVYLRSIEPLIAIILVRVCGSEPPSPQPTRYRILPVGLGPRVATQAAFLSKTGWTRTTVFAFKARRILSVDFGVILKC